MWVTESPSGDSSCWGIQNSVTSVRTQGSRVLHEWGIEGRFFSPLHDKAQKKIKPCIIVPRGFTDASL